MFQSSSVDLLDPLCMLGHRQLGRAVCLLRVDASNAIRRRSNAPCRGQPPGAPGRQCSSWGTGVQRGNAAFREQVPTRHSEKHVERTAAQIVTIDRPTYPEWPTASE